MLSNEEKRILHLILEANCVASIGMLQPYLKMSRTSIGRLLYSLEKKGFVKRFRIKDETYAKIVSTQITSLRVLFGIKAPTLYLGLLGLPRPEYPEPVTLTSLKLLEDTGIKILEVIVATSREALEKHSQTLEEFTVKKRMKISYILVSPDDYDHCLTEIKKVVEEKISKYNIVCDVTGGTKIMTLALAEIAHEHNLPIMYVYLEKMKLIKLNIEIWKAIYNIIIK